MKFSLRTLAPLLLTFVFICLPLVGLAADTPGAVGNPPANPGYVNNPPANPGYVNNPSGLCPGGSCSLKNPLSVTNFCDLLKIILKAALLIGMPIAVLFLVYVGFKFIVAQGNPEKIKEAQKNFLYTLIGIGIFLGAWTIATVIANTLTALGAPGLNSCTS